MSSRDPSMPDFVIIGAMKCATSTLHDQLDLQAGISMSDPKEPNFFSDGPNFAKGMGWYRSLFASMPADDLKGESSTHLTKYPVHPDAAERLHEALPNAKLIYVMRDPIDRIVSHYIHEWSQRTINVGINDAVRGHDRLIAYSSYAMQIGKYMRLYDRSQILPVFFERLMDDPQREFERICAHIGYDSDSVWETEQKAQNTSHQRQRRHPALNAVLNIGLVQVARRTLMPEGLRNTIKSRWMMKDRPKLNADAMVYLYEQLEPEMKRLSDLLGRPISCAQFKDNVREGSTPEWINAEDDA